MVWPFYKSTRKGGQLTRAKAAKRALPWSRKVRSRSHDANLSLICLFLSREEEETLVF